MTKIDPHLPKLRKLMLRLFLPCVAYYRAKLGIAKASCPSVRLSVCNAEVSWLYTFVGILRK